MKVKTILRSDESCSRERKGDIFVMRRNPSTANSKDGDVIHPLSQAREYTRAINASKMDRLFAKPFVGAMAGHVDGIYAMASKHPTNLRLMASGSADGSIRLWNLATQKTVWSVTHGPSSFVRGLSFCGPEALLSCGDDKTIRLWDINDQAKAPQVFQGKHPFTSIDHLMSTTTISSTSDDLLQLWDLERGVATQSWSWGADTIASSKFNQSEISSTGAGLLASCSSDCCLMLHDARTRETVKKMKMPMRGNKLSWNPQEPVYLAVASEDYSIPTFDIRFWDRAVNVMQGHVGAVLDVDWSPTGEELVSASYDKTIRIWRRGEGRSRDVYHTKRMQRLFTTTYSGDGKYILSGSDDGNVRLWKSEASAKLGPQNHRQKEAIEYSKALLKKYERMPEVRRIANHRTLPKDIKIKSRIQHDHRQSERRKLDNLRRHTSPTAVHHTLNPRSNIVKEIKK